MITSCPLPQNEAERLNTLVSLQPEFTPLDGQFSAGANKLPHEHSTVRLPDWLGEEVTHDERYSNFALAVAESAQALSALAA